MSARAIMVAVSQYDNFEEISGAADAVRELADALAASGYQVETELLAGGDSTELELKLDQKVRESDASPLILVWTGHGAKQGTSHYLLCRTSPLSGFANANAIPASELGLMAANSRATKILVIIDTCFSGVGANEAASSYARITAEHPQLADDTRAISIIASAHPLEQAQEGLFTRTLRHVLFDADAPREWRDSDQVLTADEIVVAVRKVLHDAGHRPGLDLHEQGIGKKFIPNPRYPFRLEAEDVETAARLSIRFDGTSHFELAARGIEVGQTGWYFTGRTRLLARLARWLDKQPGGIAIVTGPPGAGKSAVVGRLVTLSNPRYRALAIRNRFLDDADTEGLPPEGVIDAAIHAKQKSLAACVRDLAIALDLSIDNQLEASALVAAVAALDRRVTIAIDALDEALLGHSHRIAAQLIAPLGALPRVRVLVGTRRSLDGGLTPADEDPHQQLRVAFGPDAIIFDLSDEPQTEEDIATYVRLQLSDSRHKDNPEGLGGAARRVAAASAGIFLYARIVARTLKDQASIDTVHLPADAIGAFVADLAQRFGDQRRRVDDMLRALAWGAGAGLSRHVWPKVATVLAQGEVYDGEDVQWMLGHVGWHIVEASTPTAGVGQATYRLIHQAFVDHYRTGRDSTEAHGQIAATLAEGTKGKAWLDADPYLWRHLSYHAARSGRLDILVKDPGYLAVADPASLLTELRSISSPTGREISNIYRRSAPLLDNAEPLDRMAIIHSVALIENSAAAARLEPLLAGSWRCRWALCRPASFYQIVSRQTPAPIAVAILESDRTPMVVSLSPDNVVSLWNGRTNAHIGRFTVPGAKATCMAAAEIDGSPAIAIGADDGTATFYDTAGAVVAEPLESPAPVSAVTFGLVGSQPAIAAACGDLSIRLWKLGGETWQVFKSAGAIASLAIGGAPKRPILIAAPAERTGFDFLALDLPSGTPATLPFKLSYRFGEFVSITHCDGEAVLLSAGRHALSLSVRRLDEGGRVSRPLLAHAGNMTSLAAGRLDGRTVAVCSAEDGSIWVGDIVAQTQPVDPVAEMANPVGSRIFQIFLGKIDDRDVLAANVIGFANDRVRLLDAATGQPFRRTGLAIAARRLLARLTDRISARKPSDTMLDGPIALGRIGKRTVAAAARFGDGIRLWETDISSRADTVIKGKFMANSLFLSELRGKPLVAVQGYWFEEAETKTFGAWDARTGESRDRDLESLAGHSVQTAHMFAAAEIAGQPLFALGDNDSGIVQVWNGRTGRPVGQPMKSHGLDAFLSTDEGNPVLISTSREKTEVWDVATGTDFGKPLEDYAEFKVGFSTESPRPLVYGERLFLAGLKMSEIWVWDPRTGRRLMRCKPMVRIDEMTIGWDGDLYLVDRARGVVAINIVLPSPDPQPVA